MGWHLLAICHCDLAVVAAAGVARLDQNETEEVEMIWIWESRAWLEPLSELERMIIGGQVAIYLLAIWLTFALWLIALRK